MTFSTESVEFDYDISYVALALMEILKNEKDCINWRYSKLEKN